MTGDGPSNGSVNGNGERLDSWKSIASYLGRDIGTVRRWERTRGLPIHRVPGGKGSSVFAYTAEIDEWLKSAPSEPATPESLPAPPEAPRNPASWRWAAAAVAVAAAVAIIWWMQRAPRRIEAVALDLRVELTPQMLTARAPGGADLWVHRLGEDSRHFLSEVSERVRVLTSNTPSIFFTTSHRMRRADDVVEGGEFTSLDLNGSTRWRYTFNDTLTFGGKSFGPPWAVTAFAVDDTTPTRRIAVAAHHWLWGPSLMAILGDDGRRIGMFANDGWIEQLQWLSPDRLAIGGFLESMNGGMAALIDPSRLDGQAPEPPGSSHHCTNCGQNAPLRMVVMPRSEVNLLTHSRFNRAILERMPDRLIVRTVEVPPGPESAGAADAIYEFSPELELRSASFSQRYWEIHDRLEVEKKVNHSREACPDREGPRVIHTWSAERGWAPHQIR